MSPAPILLPSCAEDPFTTPDVSGLAPRTISGCLPNSGTLPSLRQWQSLDLNISRSQSSPHLPQFAPRTRRVARARRSKFVSRCSEATLSSSGSTLPLTPLSMERISATPTLRSSDNRDLISPTTFWESPSILQDWPYHEGDDLDGVDDAQCLVYRSVDDCLPRLIPNPPQLSLDSVRCTAVRPPFVRNSERKPTLDNTFSSNRALSPRSAQRPAPFVLSIPVSVVSQFVFAGLTESVSRFSGELAASMMAKYQNLYGDHSRKRIGERNKRFKWDQEMRALEMDQWLLDEDAIWHN